MYWRAGLFAALILSSQSAAVADEIKVAVAANFAGTLDTLIERFEATTDDEIVSAAGSTGQHYAQIINGAPFDLFLAADAKRPQMLEQAGLIVAGTRITYAIGKLVLWSPDPSVDAAAGAALSNESFRYLAIADPELAPYGAAARDVLRAKGRWDELQSRIVRGRNVSQAYQFVMTGHAELGFVAATQIVGLQGGSVWRVPPELHAPLVQQAVLLRDRPATRRFLVFLQSRTAHDIIRARGYNIAQD